MIAAVVPTRNENTTIGPLVRALYERCEMVIVADDSDDTTPLVALDAGADVIDAEGGLGGAYRTAWEHVPQNWWVLHVDAGGSFSLMSIDRVIAAARADVQGDMIIGSRFAKGGTHVGNFVRGIASRAAAVACSFVTGRWVTDWTSGLRAYSPAAWKYLADHEMRCEGHAWQIESLHLLINGGFIVTEVPVDYHAGRSSLNRARVKEAVTYWWSMWK